jgi:hypothetical protein
MSDHLQASGLVQTWVPVTDNQGRTHLEAHWAQASAADTHVTQAA